MGAFNTNNRLKFFIVFFSNRDAQQLEKYRKPRMIKISEEMKKKVFNVLNILSTLVSTGLIGFILCFKYFHIQPIQELVHVNSSIPVVNVEAELSKLDYLCWGFIGINGFVLVISMCSTIASTVNNKSCYLILMIAVFLTAIIFLIILGTMVGMSFGSDIAKAIKSSDTFTQMLAYQIDQLTIIFIVHIGIHLILLITTGIITTIIYCNHKQQHEDDQTSGMARVTGVNKSNTNMLYARGGVNGVGHGVIVRDPRTHTSESFCFSKYHGFNNGGPSPVPNLVTSQSNNNLDAVQDRKLPTLPNSQFKPVHSTSRKDPSFRSAPNLNRIHSNPYSQPNPPPAKSTDDSSAADSNDVTDKSPLIRNKVKANLNYSRRKLCTSMTEDELTLNKLSDPQIRRSPIRSISEASAFVASLSQENPPKIPPRPHERQRSASYLSVSFDMKSTPPTKKSIEDIYEAGSIFNKRARLITVPEPSEADEDSMGYTKIKEENENNDLPEIQDSICHV